VVLLLHGFMGNSNDFDNVIGDISDRFCFLTLDLPGHGATKVIGSEEYYTMPQTALGLVELIQKERIDRCYLIGYSMGGRLALYLTINFPNYFTKVILESTSPGLKNREQCQQRIDRDEELAAELTTKDLAVFLQKWYENPLFDSFREHPGFTKAIKQRLNNNPVELAKSLRNMSLGLQPSLWHKLDHNKIPLLLLAGELDKKFIAINRKINNLCPHSQLNIIDRAGHNIHFEQPQQYARIIRSFFQ
jgi:2-succinyl-6-hydroxy-2,4-cyclohexadiene-1-carboxylate synthase